MDDCFCWWRWAEVRHRTLQPSIESQTASRVAPFLDQYSISASLMAMSIAISLGIREQNALASIFMCAVAHSNPLHTRLLTDRARAPERLHWCTMAFGFLVESVPLHRTPVSTASCPACPCSPRAP